jgi:geranylgeranyl diphosphate/geranylgeranyl-bacteriochlorophyllide a reductase
VAAGEYDVAIIGAGAAGCAAALRLPPGARALLVDCTAPPGGRCCGGLLAPDGQKALAALGLALPADVRVEPQPRKVHVLDLDTRREQTYRRNYINLDRARFDAWLAEQASQRAEFRPDTRFVAAEPDGPDATRLRLSSGGREESVRASLVIGADGADSLVRLRCLSPDGRPPVMLAIQVRIASAAPPACHEVFFSRRLVPEFYAWAIPKPGSVLVGAAFSNVSRARELFDLLLPLIRQELGLEGEEVERSARRLTQPQSRRQLSAGAGRVLLAGEAAGLVSPSSGEGLSFALESGAAAGAAASCAAYNRAFQRLARRVARKLLKARVIFSPRLRPLAMRLPWCP